MTSTAHSLRERMPSMPAWPKGLPRVSIVAETKPPSWGRVVTSWALTLISAILLAVLVNLILVSQLQHWTAQHRLYSQLRLSLAQGSAPIGQVGADQKLVAPGTPIALLDIPRLHVHEVVVEGTASHQTKLGVGHRRDTPMPGQAGVSVLMGRHSAYGGVFRHLDRLVPGDTFTVTTGQGRATYTVIGPRVGTVKVPELTADQGRLTLITATGGPFQPQHVLRVDADLSRTSTTTSGSTTTSPSAFARPPAAFAPGVITNSEQAMSGDPSRAFSLSWLVELLAIAAAATVWSWKRWSRRATWMVCVPVLALLALACADRVTDFLPNLM